MYTIDRFVHYLKWIAISYLLAEIFRLGWFVGGILHSTYLNQESGVSTSIGYAALFISLLLFIFRLRRLRMPSLFPVCSRKNIELLICISVGILTSLTFSDLLSNIYISTLENLNFFQLCSSFLIMGLLLTLPFHYRLQKNEARDNTKLFLSDKEISSISEDKLGFTENVIKFAKRVLDSGGSENLVFGLDAPWGIGKSSYLRLCQDYWEKHHADKVIIFKFSPISYPSDMLIEHFVNQFLNCIRKEIYSPELAGVAQRYTRTLRQPGNFSLFGLQIPFSTFAASEGDVSQRIENALLKNNKRVISIIDDLDRIDFSESRDLLFLVGKIFLIKNVNHVIAYDSEALTKDDYNEKNELIEYIEKFINIKISIYPSLTNLQNYIDYIPTIYEETPVNLHLISEVMSGIRAFYISEESDDLGKFINNVRKLKHIVNTIFLMGLHELDLTEVDINPTDFTCLLLLYINYPSTFRDIYYAETSGRSGKFSLVPNILGGKNDYKNSESYKSYIKNLESDPRINLLEKLFNEGRVSANPSDEERSKMACFNDGYSGKNLETYLNIIVDVAEPVGVEQYEFYNQRFLELKDDKSIQDIFQNKKFENEEVHRSFWRYISQHAKELSSKKAKEVINFALKARTCYPAIGITKDGHSFRFDISIYITRLINDVGWNFEKQDSNSVETYEEILSYIYGNDGVVKLFLDPISVEGLHDILLFRLYCSANRGRDIFNLAHALAFKQDNETTLEESVNRLTIKGLRPFSQYIFKSFKKQYIEHKISIIEETRNLTRTDLYGQSEESHKNAIEIEKMHWQMIDFMIYQLSNIKIDLGIGCGFYDEEGSEDASGIHVAMNEYLFKICFEPSKLKNLKNFLSFLMTQYDQDFFEKNCYTHHFSLTMKPEMLKEYWNRNSTKLKQLMKNSPDLTVHTRKYSLSVKEIGDQIITDIENI